MNAASRRPVTGPDIPPRYGQWIPPKREARSPAAGAVGEVPPADSALKDSERRVDDHLMDRPTCAADSLVPKHLGASSLKARLRFCLLLSWPSAYSTRWRRGSRAALLTARLRFRPLLSGPFAYSSRIGVTKRTFRSVSRKGAVPVKVGFVSFAV